MRKEREIEREKVEDGRQGGMKGGRKGRKSPYPPLGILDPPLETLLNIIIVTIQ